MNKSGRITKNYEYQNIFQNGSSVATHSLVLYQFANLEKENRVGFIVSKKVGNAVTRNRVKRLLREGYRMCAGQIKCGYDLIFIARPPAATIRFDQAATEMKRIIHRGGLFTASSIEQKTKEKNNR